MEKIDTTVTTTNNVMNLTFRTRSRTDDDDDTDKDFDNVVDNGCVLLQIDNIISESNAPVALWLLLRFKKVITPRALPYDLPNREN